MGVAPVLHLEERPLVRCLAAVQQWQRRRTRSSPTSDRTPEFRPDFRLTAASACDLL